MKKVNKTARSNLPPELHELAEQVGDFMQYWGFKKVHGRIWVNLFLAEHPLDASDLIDRLKVSKALISISLKELLDHKVILEVGKSPDSTLLYKANPNIMEAILSVLRMRERKVLSRVQGAYKTLKKLSHEEKKEAQICTIKFKQLGEFIEAGDELLESFLQFQNVDMSLWMKFLGDPKN